MLSVKLRHLDAWIESRRANAQLYATAFKGSAVRTFEESDDDFSVYHLYVVEVPKRDAVCAALDAAGIDWGIHYPTPIHQQEAYRGFPIAPRPLPVAEARSSAILSLPMFAELQPVEIEKVVQAVLSAIE
jgi:dTDP-4-amino-4,6-dideoxygalactose transaminase